jgi:hypothetical protein
MFCAAEDEGPLSVPERTQSKCYATYSDPKGFILLILPYGEIASARRIEIRYC